MVQLERARKLIPFPSPLSVQLIGLAAHELCPFIINCNTASKQLSWSSEIHFNELPNLRRRSWEHLTCSQVGQKQEVLLHLKALPCLKNKSLIIWLTFF